MTKEEIIEYVMETPENTNPNVLEGMLDELVNSSGGGSMPFYVTFSGDSSDSTAACDKTFAEVKEAYDAGKVIIIRYLNKNNISGEYKWIYSGSVMYGYNGEELTSIGGEHVSYIDFTHLNYRASYSLSSSGVYIDVEY